jgi:hypothetical protein
MTADEVKREIDGATEMFQAWESEHGISVSPSIHFTGENLSFTRALGFGGLCKKKKVWCSPDE